MRPFSTYKPKTALILPGEPPPFSIFNPVDQTHWLFLCEHACRRIPGTLGLLGLPQYEVDRHIGWDIGILALTQQVAQQLNAPVLFQQYSRLVIDCNRQLASDQLIPEISETTIIPGNQHLTRAQRQQRIDDIWQPYQDAVRAWLERHPTPGPVVMNMHSFTPCFKGEKRDWHIGLLYNRHSDTAMALRHSLLALEPGLNIGMNQPYDVSDDEDYTIPVFGEAMGFDHVLVEIRQDLISDPGRREKWITLFTHALQNLKPI